MSYFEDMIAKDNEVIFLDIDEYGEIHEINGDPLKAIVQDVTSSSEATTGGGVTQVYPGVYGSHVMVNCRKGDLEEVPVYGMVIDLDDHEYMVEQVNDDMGMLTILLVANDR